MASRAWIKGGKIGGGTCHNDKPGLPSKGVGQEYVVRCMDLGGEVAYASGGGEVKGETCHNDKPGLGG